ncbi:MAG TPA: hypothetical protein V6C52_14520 [Coleofasciculaceae cyanobacterium]
MEEREKSADSLQEKEFNGPDVSLIEQYANQYDTDILFLNGMITAEFVKPAIILSRQIRRKNVLLILVTPGGDPNVAYRLARFLQKHFARFTLFVTGPCKSAGTLVALGAHELIFGDFGELGPLDIQMLKKDDPLSQESGVATLSSLRMLTDEALDWIERETRKIRALSGGSISVRTASELITNAVIGLYKPILAQLDPIHLGEMQRALRITEEYGRRLIEKGQNADIQALKKLIEEYPAHAFIIDEPEAKNLFKSVRTPNALEQLIILALGDLALMPTEREIVPYGHGLLFLNKEDSSLSINAQFDGKVKHQKDQQSENS